MTVKVIYDTDPGIDDAMALWLLARSPEIDLRAITTVFGNASVETTTRNALVLSTLYGLKLPVAAGASKAIAAADEGDYPAHVHGDDGLGGMSAVAEPAKELLDPRPAHQLICDMVNAEPGAITLIAVGPFTNLALALRHDPSIVNKVRQVILMGGAFGTLGHGGNVTPVAEANVINDPEAADLVLTAAWPIVVVGLDVTQQVVMTEDYLSSQQGRGGKVGDFLWQATRHYQDFYSEVAGIRGVYSHDASAVAYAIDPSAFTLRRGPIRVVCEGMARGQTIQDHRNLGLPGGHPGRAAWTGRPVQQACIGVDAQRVIDIFDQAFN
ncbi:nucleoside hydrolase [Pelomonas sp. KK5]|uniref:nucleoside hydrolase n=1 Tax=Pelomonas sp. KK5 TaxID=1855730 RepID=UPI00097BE528|nr:nucleoside hydrolase [Pelomonas sp. KK5]